MARVRQFFTTTASARRHPTVVDCGWQVLKVDGSAVLQLSTYGSDDRASPPKVSQTLQLDEQSARELVGIIEQAFPDVRGPS